MFIHRIQIKEDATLANVIALLNMMNLTTNLDKVVEVLQKNPGIIINKIEIPESKNEKSGSHQQESAETGAAPRTGTV